MDTADTLPVDMEGGKEKDWRNVPNLPALDPPSCLEEVLTNLEAEPVDEIDPCSQHKKQFKASKEHACKGHADMCCKQSCSNECVHVRGGLDTLISIV